MSNVPVRNAPIGVTSRKDEKGLRGEMAGPKIIKKQTAVQIDAAKFVLWMVATSLISAAAALSTLIASMSH
jgi:hypothetical protein